MGDLMHWKGQQFDMRDRKPIPESFVWLFFLQIIQALAFIQGRIGPECGIRGCIIHCDIKPMNILVVNNGIAYPSFKLHDFDCATIYKDSKANQISYYGIFQWQPPENTTEGIDTETADIWALGTYIHFLVIGRAPVTIDDSSAFADAQYRANNDQHPASVQQYKNLDCYYDAHAPRRIIPINLDKDDADERDIRLSTEKKRAQGIGPEYHRYSDELNDWMMQCLSFLPSERPTTKRLRHIMGAQAMEMLRKMGGKSALVDMEAKFGAGT